jgi:putative spermidine/putrescine transport system substrate-binding protein
MRKFWLISTVFTLALTAAGAVAEDTVTFASWGGAYQKAQRDALLTPAEDLLGVKILEDTLTGLAEVRAQVRAGAVTWDIVDLEIDACVRAAQEGLLEPLDFSIVSKDGFENAAVSDHWIGVIYFSTVLAYSTEAYGDNPPRSWADFWDVERFPGARAMQKDPSANVEIALIADGVPLDEVYPIDLDRAFKKLDEIKPYVDIWWSSGAQSAQLMKDGEVEMSTIWNGRMDAAMADGAEGDYTYNGGVASLDCLAIPKGSENVDAAMKVLAAMVSPDLQANIPTYINYGPTNSAAFTLGKISDEMAARSPSAPDNLKSQVIVRADWWAENGEALQERWDSWHIE